MARAIDLTNQTFGRLTAIRDIGSRKKQRFWLCQCTCGNTTEVPTASLRSGNTTSCGCYSKDLMKETRFIDLTGKKFGRLTVIGKTGDKTTSGYVWSCRCECGSIKNVPSEYLSSGDTKSCGCLRREITSNAFTTHGRTGTREYRVWKGMIQRCSNENMNNFQHYGGRGIGVCERWRTSFENFYADMGPSNGLTLERRENGQDYGPDNCYWANGTVQNFNRNMRINNTTGVTGVSFDSRLGKYHATLAIEGKLFLDKRYASLEEATEARRWAEEVHLAPYLAKHSLT